MKRKDASSSYGLRMSGSTVAGEGSGGRSGSGSGDGIYVDSMDRTDPTHEGDEVEGAARELLDQHCRR